jgi:hypothetical protein
MPEREVAGAAVQTEEKREDRKNAFLDFVIRCDDGLLNVKTERMAREAIKEMFARFPDAPSRILRRIVFSQFSDALFLDLAEMYRESGCNWGRFRQDAFDLNSTFWGDLQTNSATAPFPFPASVVLKTFSGLNDLTAIIETNRWLDRFLDPFDPFYEVKMDSDLYWERRVRFQIAAPNYQEAWCEIERAIRGFGEREEVVTDIFRERGDPVALRGDRFYASNQLVTKLGVELYEAAQQAGLAPEIPHEDEDELPRRISLLNYLARANSRKDFVGVPRIWGHLSEEGVKLAELAIHFRRQRRGGRPFRKGGRHRDHLRGISGGRRSR